MREKKEKEDNSRCSKETMANATTASAVSATLVGLLLFLLIVFGFFKHYNVWDITNWGFIGILIAIATTAFVLIIGIGIATKCTAKEIME